MDKESVRKPGLPSLDEVRDKVRDKGQKLQVPADFPRKSRKDQRKDDNPARAALSPFRTSHSARRSGCVPAEPYPPLEQMFRLDGCSRSLFPRVL